MSKAFTREETADDDDAAVLPQVPAGTRNYITPAGYARLRSELLDLIDVERPKVVDVVHWAASNGDRSENGDYLYGKKRLREIDRRIRFLTKRLEIAEVVNPSVHGESDQVFFGATVTYVDDEDVERTITIMGIDEADSALNQVSWIAPVSRALLKSRVGDEVAVLVERLRPLDEIGHVLKCRDLCHPMLLLPALVLGERQPAARSVARAPEVGREWVEVGEGDVALDLDRVRPEQLAQERHLHGLGLEVVDDELAHIARADAVVGRVVEPVVPAQQAREPRLADAGHAKHRHRMVRGLQKLVWRGEQHGVSPKISGPACN